MKLFGVDVSAKHIFFEMDGKSYSIHLRDSIRKGIWDVSVWDESGKKKIRLEGAYTPLKTVIREMWRIHIPLWFREKAHRLYSSLKNGLSR